jgi:hypothetical protein
MGTCFFLQGFIAHIFNLHVNHLLFYAVFFSLVFSSNSFAQTSKGTLDSMPSMTNTLEATPQYMIAIEPLRAYAFDAWDISCFWAIDSMRAAGIRLEILPNLRFPSLGIGAGLRLYFSKDALKGFYLLSSISCFLISFLKYKTDEYFESYSWTPSLENIISVGFQFGYQLFLTRSIGINFGAGYDFNIIPGSSYRKSLSQPDFSLAICYGW